MNLSRWLPYPVALLSALGIMVVRQAPAQAQTSCSSTGDPRGTSYQFRPAMDRCEGIRGSRPISAVGLRLANYTIGQPQSQRRQDRGEVIGLLVPITDSASGGPAVTVQARGTFYQMIPMALGSPRQGWRPFEWGAGLLLREGISVSQLRATALLRQPGDADQWLPVKFAPAGAYSLVIAGNSAVQVAHVRILGPDNRLVRECSGPTRLETELQCRWDGRDKDGRNTPAGSYRLVALAADGGGALLNVSLRHDPTWLAR